MTSYRIIFKNDRYYVQEKRFGFLWMFVRIGGGESGGWKVNSKTEDGAREYAEKFIQLDRERKEKQRTVWSSNENS